MRSLRRPPKAIFVLVLLAAIHSSACVKSGLPLHLYPESSVPLSGQAVKLKVGIFWDDSNPSQSLLQKLFASRFSTELAKTGLFQSVAFQDGNADVMFKVSISATESGRFGPSFLWGITVFSYFAFVLLGAPSDWTDARVTLTVRAFLPHSDSKLLEWSSFAEKRGHAGIYYQQWPLGLATQKAVKDVLSQIAKDSRTLNRILETRTSSLQRQGVLNPHAEQVSGESKSVGEYLQSGDSVAVLDAEAETTVLDLASLSGLGDHLSDLLAATGLISTIPRTEIKNTAKRLIGSASGSCQEPKCRTEIGKALGAKSVVYMTVEKQGSSCVSSFVVYNLKSGSIENRISLTGLCDYQSLTSAIDYTAPLLR